jgi:DNA-binding beta-propeller fold protein YncE
VRFPIRGRPEGIVSNAGYLWIADNLKNDVIRMKADGSSPQRMAVAEYPYGMASNSTSVWVASATARRVTRILTSTEKQSPFAVGRYPLFLTADDDVVYVADAVQAGRKATVDGSVIMLDAHDGHRIGDSIPVGKKPLAIVMGDGSAWVANRDSDSVSRITNGRVVKEIDVEGRPVGLLFHDHSVWVASRDTNRVTRINTETSSVDRSVRVGNQPYALGYFGGSLWVSNRGDGTIWRLDLKTGHRVGDPIDVPDDPVDMTAHDGHLWVTAIDGVPKGENGAVYRIDP